MSDWFCEYCQETANPLDHSCNKVTLKSRLSHLSAVNEKLEEALGIIKIRKDDCKNKPCAGLHAIAEEALKLADEIREGKIP